MGPLAMAAAPHLMNLFAPAAQNILQPTSMAMGNLLSAPTNGISNLINAGFNHLTNKIAGHASPPPQHTFSTQQQNFSLPAQSAGNFGFANQNQNYRF